MAIYVTRRARFSAAHRLYNPNFSDERNREVYGLCCNPNGHGHDYRLEVTLKGEPDPETGMIVDLKWLKRVIDERVVQLLDHKHLNLDVPFLEGVIPTVENLARAIWDILEASLPGRTLFSVKLLETENNWAVYFGGREEKPTSERSSEAVEHMALTNGIL